ncbi:hypothetical protein [Lacinutrix sp. 5H-3-7-4]|uniref:hypothetical protein n=1 Tax=Lacinutrix sp. (strain 5H-3-7-4) TaxID=983544 RepID=UPI00020A3A7D|nr:hypothetical protein [Lacinutrix sp. 5H-3-7-4]AEH01092.1 secreted protein [Lacinutrix sp. 5H-3-7-4]
MKKIATLLLLLVTFTNSCKKDDDINNQNQNPNIPNAVFDTQNLIDTGLPQYNNLLIPSQHVIVTGGNIGINGIVVYYTGSSYLAWELSDPNHQISNCSTLTVNGIVASCSCDDDNSYFIANGLPESGTTGQYTLVPYQVEVNGNVIRVYNN